jgi:hypothetical protein
VSYARSALANYLSVGKFIYNNYKQALTILREEEKMLCVIETGFSVSRADFPGHLEEEKEWLRSLESEPPAETMAMDYIERLTLLGLAEYAPLTVTLLGF